MTNINMDVWLCRWPNEANPDSVETARKYLREGKYLASNGQSPKGGDLVVFRNSVNMRDNANEDRFSTFATGVVSKTLNEAPPNWQYEQRTSYILFKDIKIHNHEFEDGAFSTWTTENWPNSPPNNQFVRLNQWQRQELGL